MASKLCETKEMVRTRHIKGLFAQGMKEYGICRDVMCEKMGVRYSAYSKHMNNPMEMRVGEFFRVCDALHIKVDLTPKDVQM